MRRIKKNERTIEKSRRIRNRTHLKKYQDFDTSPGNEGIEKIRTCFYLPGNTYYFIYAYDLSVGVIRIIDHNDGQRKKKISPIFIMKECRNKGYAQAAIREAESIHGKDGWMDARYYSSGRGQLSSV